MSIAVITIGDQNIQSYSKHTFVINQNYCSKHQYTYIQYGDTLDPSRPIPWSKILAIKNHIMYFDWIFYIDADAIFFNHDTKIEDYIDTKYNLIISKAVSENWANQHYSNDKEFCNINTGSFLLKGKNTWSSYLLDYIYSKTYRINHKWWENQALADIYLENNCAINSKIKIRDQYDLNGFEKYFYGYLDYNSDQYIMHWAGMSIADKEYFVNIRYNEFLENKFNGQLKTDRYIYNNE
jgi:hypothetical protein